MKAAAKAFPTMITPYNRDGSVDTGALDALTEWYWEKGCGGIFASCQSSEIFFLSEDERVLLAERVKRKADALAAAHPEREPMIIVASGHTSDRREDQIRELTRIADTGVDAVILISNRLDIPNTGDTAWAEDCRRLKEALPEVPLGVYECPHPYKRLLTPGMLKVCRELDFRFIKDTCCDAEEITRRLKQLEGSGVALYNANAQTLYQTLKEGAAGYCGVMANFHPELYVWLCSHFEDARAEKVGALLSMLAFTESLAYPCTAKYHLDRLAGISMEHTARSRDVSQLTEYHKNCVRQMKLLADGMAAELGL